MGLQVMNCTVVIGFSSPHSDVSQIDEAIECAMMGVSMMGTITTVLYTYLVQCVTTDNRLQISSFIPLVKISKDHPTVTVE